jgi:LDH2 family malate/lactate/ureidoglycolate dehydrogenase
MRVSRNELTAVLRKAFEGLGFGTGEREDAADMVAWLELHGLHGLSELGKALAYLEREGSRRLQLRYSAPGLRVLDAEGASILCGGGIAVDTGIAMARADGLGVVRVDACHNRALTVGYLVRAARRGISVLASWHNGADPGVRWVVAHGAGEVWPSVRLIQPAGATDPAAGRHLTLWFSADVDPKPELHASVTGERVLLDADPDTMARCYRDGIERGLAVDDAFWKQLQGLGRRVLVAAEFGSRDEAGGGAEG